MADQIPEFYKHAIYSIYDGVIDIKYPKLRGHQNSLMFVITNYGEFVVKFGSRDMVLKNSAVSHLASENGIPTPDITAVEFKDIWFETYPLIKGKTLFEYIRDGMPINAIKQAFEDMLTNFVRMERLPIEQINGSKCSQVHETAYEHGKQSNGLTIARLLRKIVYVMNLGWARNTGLYHCDITPKNVIVDANGHLTSFLDIDSMAISNRSYAFSVLADKWVEQGFCLNELYDKYEYMIGRAINRTRINAMLNTVHAGKFIMYHTGKHKIR